MGQKHKRFREFWTPFLLRVIRKNPRSMYARVSKAMAQFVLKIEKLSHIMGPTPILEMARTYGLRPRLWLLIKAIDHKFWFMVWKTIWDVGRTPEKFVNHSRRGSWFTNSSRVPATSQVVYQALLFNFHAQYEFRFSDWLICTTWYWVVTKQPPWRHYRSLIAQV